MNDDAGNAPLIDTAILGELERRVGRARLLSVLQTYVEHHQMLLDELRAASASPSHADIYRAVHQLAGASGSLGLARLSREALAAEAAVEEAAETRAAQCQRILQIAQETSAELGKRYGELVF